jgi:fimbrial chaperone protein
MMTIVRLIQTALLIVLMAWPAVSSAGAYRVSPIRLFFGEQTKTGAVTLFNESPDPLQLQIKAFEWGQDAAGKDTYTPTDDVIFFPKIMKIEKGEKKIIRAGIKQIPPDREKTYRLFIEELPGPRKQTDGSRVEISIRFGLPIFVTPSKAEAKGVIQNVSLTGGKLVMNVANAGNAHFKIDSIHVKGLNAKGAETLSQELQGWYLLAGSTRVYDMPVSREVCQDTAKFQISVKTEKFTLQDELNGIQTLCLP